MSTSEAPPQGIVAGAQPAVRGRPDVPAYKQARGYTYEADEFGASGLRPDAIPESDARAVVESPVHQSGVVQAMHAAQGEEAGLLAIELGIPGSRSSRSRSWAMRPRTSIR